MDQSMDEINEEGSYQPPDTRRHRSRSPETSSPRERHRYNVTDRRYRYDGYLDRSDGSYSYKLTPSQWMETAILDKMCILMDQTTRKHSTFWHNVKKLHRK